MFLGTHSQRNNMDWDKLSVDGDTFQPTGDLLRVEVKCDHIIKMLNAIHNELKPSNGTNPTF